MDLLDVLAAQDAKLGPIGKAMIEECFGGWNESLLPPKGTKKMLKKIEQVKAHALDKQARLARINKYRQQIESGTQEIEYDVNEEKLNIKMIAFVNVAIQINIAPEFE